MRDKCDVCHRPLVSSCGPLDADILLVGEFPGWEEIKKGAPFVGRTEELLRDELAKVGIQYRSCRMTNLWQHEIDAEGCNISYHVRELGKEMNRHKYILLMGSEITKTYLNKGIMELSGMRLTGPLFPVHTVVIAAPHPGTVFRGRIGEFRLALQKFVKYIQEESYVTV